MANFYKIAESGVDQPSTGMTIAWFTTECGRHLRLKIEDRDQDTQLAAQRALAMLASACDFHSVLEDTPQLHGLPIKPEDWAEVERAVFPPRRRQAANVNEPRSPKTAPQSRTGRFVYVISAIDADPPLTKIGIANSPEKRLQTLSTSSPHALRLELTRYTDDAPSIERAAHIHFRDMRRNGEWFAISPEQAIHHIIARTGRPA